MVDRWYNEPNCDWFDEEREHMEILSKRIESACKVAAVVSAFSILGIIGSADIGKITTGQFVAYMLVAVAVLVTAIKIGSN